MARPSIQAAEAAFSAGDLAGAETISRQLLDDPELMPAACHLLGVIALGRGEPDQAIQWMERAIENGLRSTTVLSNCGEAYRRLGRLEEAYARFEQALKTDNTNAFAHFNLGLVMRAQGYAREAEHFFRTVLALTPDMARACYELAELYRQEGHWPEAEREYGEALTLARSTGGGATAEQRLHWSVRLASLLRERGRPLQSVDLLEEVLKADEYAPAHYELARAQFELCWEAAAQAHYMRALELQPSLGLHAPARTTAARLTAIKPWCDAGGGRYTQLARSHPLALPPLQVVPPSAAGGFMLGAPVTPELGCAVAQEAEVLPRDFAVLSRGHLVVGGVVNWFQHYTQRGALVRHDTDDGRVLLDLPARLSEHDGACVLLGKADDSYAWLYEALARLWVVEQQPALAGLPLVVPADLSQQHLDLLGRFDISEDRLLRLESDCVLKARELHVPSLMTVGDWVSPLALQFLRRRLGGGPARAHRRVYLSREGLADRRVANETELLGLLQGHGFEVVGVAGKSPLELMAVLREAQAVIGVDDETMAYLVVAPQGAQVGIIATGGAYRPRAHFICGQLSQNLTYLVGDVVYESNPVHALCDVALPEDVLRVFLGQLGSQRR